MVESERQEFAAFLPSYIGKNADKEAMRRWWFALRPFALDEIKAAFVRRDQEMGGYPEPFQIIERIKTVKSAQRISEPTRQKHWTSLDLICACNFAEIDWSVKRYGFEDRFTGTWVERVAKNYDAGLAEACERITGKRPDLRPTDAAREFLAAYVKQEPRGWFLPVAGQVPL